MKYAPRLELSDEEIVTIAAAARRGVQAFAADGKALKARSRTTLTEFVAVAEKINERGFCVPDADATSTQQHFESLVRVNEIAQRAGCSEELVRRACRAGVLQPYSVRTGKRRIGVEAAAAAEWIAEKKRNRQ
jgi:predicted DNA-binding transcriptional regulator AlpA